MNAITVNPLTGYQESPNCNSSFNSDKKVEFLKLAREIIDNHEYPNVGDICKVLDINVRTFQRHLEIDEKFAEDWRELELKGEATCLSDMYALRKKNPMYMFGWLRARLPEKYDSSRKVEINGDLSWVKKLNDAISTVNQPIIATDAEIISTPPKINDHIDK